MGLLATIGAWGKAAAIGLGLVKQRQDQLDRQEAKQDGARAQQAQDLAAENEELREDAEIYMRPGGSAEDVLDRLRARARERLRRSAGDQ